MAAQHSHVPKFGNWDDDNDNIPYTIYFENAQKDKGGVKMNPNDPEENPEAFMCVRESLAVNVNSNDSISSSEKQQIKGHSRPPAHPRNIITTSNQQKSGSHRSITSSESGSEGSGSDYSLMQPAGHRRVKSDMKKKKTSSDHGNNSFSNSTSVTRHATERTGSYSSNDHHTAHHRVASVPKFGAWDESDPKSGEGFTVIFNKVKEEKQIAATYQFASTPTQASYDSNAHGHGRSSSRSKICCCLFSSESDQ